MRTFARLVRVSRTLHFVAVLAVIPCSVAASEAESVVQNFLEARSRALGDEAAITLHPGSLSLDACKNPSPFLPTGERTPRWGRLSVGVNCSDGSTRYLQAEVKVQGEYVVPVKNIAAGTVISADLLTTQRGDLAQLPRNAVRRASEVVGQTARQTLAANRPLQAQQLSKPALVRAGQSVTIVSGGPGFRITRSGEAIDAGGLGDTVRVRIGPRQQLDAVVSAAGEVSVELQQ